LTLAAPHWYCGSGGNAQAPTAVQTAVAAAAAAATATAAAAAPASAATAAAAAAASAATSAAAARIFFDVDFHTVICQPIKTLWLLQLLLLQGSWQDVSTVMLCYCHGFDLLGTCITLQSFAFACLQSCAFLCTASTGHTFVTCGSRADEYKCDVRFSATWQSPEQSDDDPASVSSDLR
jgi:hypothetical protein